MMKVTKCDTCGSEHGRTYKYNVLRNIKYIDLCINCVQDWVLKNQTKLSEVVDGNTSGKNVIHG